MQRVFTACNEMGLTVQIRALTNGFRPLPLSWCSLLTFTLLVAIATRDLWLTPTHSRFHSDVKNMFPMCNIQAFLARGWEYLEALSEKSIRGGNICLERC